MLIRYHGHSFLELQTDSTILVDPFITGNPLCTSAVDSFNPDAILLTHGHRDHYGDTEAIAKNNSCKVYSIAELSKWVSALGIDSFGFNIGGSFNINKTKIFAVEAKHSNSTPDGSYGGLACGFVVLFEDKTIYIAGDTSYFSDMKLIGKKFKIDCAFIPIGGTYTMDTEDAALAAKDISPDICVPVHYNTFSAVSADVGKFCSYLVHLGINCIIIEPGGSIDV